MPLCPFSLRCAFVSWLLLGTLTGITQPATLPAPHPLPCDSVYALFYSLLSEGNTYSTEESAYMMWRMARQQCARDTAVLRAMSNALYTALQHEAASMLQEYAIGKLDPFEPAPCRLAADKASLLRYLSDETPAQATHHEAQRLFWQGLALAALRDTTSLLAALDSLQLSLQLSLQADPASSLANNAIGEVLIRLGRYPEALNALRQAIAKNPANASAHENRGIAFMGMERYDSATSALKVALRLDPTRTYLQQAIATPHVYFINAGNLFFIQKTESIPTVNAHNYVDKIREEVHGVSINMIHVPRGTFVMGDDRGALDTKPPHTVSLADFYMSETEITTNQWQAIMGYSYRMSYETCGDCPVTNISKKEIEIFLNNLKMASGKPYRLPTEAEWEYAAGGGNIARTPWSGTTEERTLHRFSHYAKSGRDAPYPVKGLFPNRLNLYDMGGNVMEWCQDWYAPAYAAQAETNPTGPAAGEASVVRGGSWNDNAANLRVTTRSYFGPTMSDHNLGFRVVFLAESPLQVRENPASAAPSAARPPLVRADSVATPLRKTINGVSFAMLPVPGGTFQMGGASGDPDEQPAHTVSIRGFYLGETEVTWALFHAVEKDAHPTPCEDCPARMSFTEAQAFITTLNTITGETYYIPTEAEWEYAAGGGKNNRTTWAGTSQAAELEHFAWLDGAIPHPVKQKQPNPLGLYDMSGNVWEWCQDWHGSYPSDPQTNPQGAKTGYSVVYRGGATNSDAASSRVANRSSRDPNDKGTNIGLRLARYSD